MTLLRVALAFTLPMLIGCAAVPASSEHALWINWRGYVSQPARGVSRFDVVPVRSPDRAINQVVDGLRKWRQGGGNRAVIFIHGGLSTIGGAEARLAKTAEIMSDGAYPIFINWDSSLISSYFWEHLFVTREGREVHPAVAFATFPFQFAGDVSRGVAQVPQSWLLEVAAVLKGATTVPGIKHGIAWAQQKFGFGEILDRDEWLRARDQRDALLCDDEANGTLRLASGKQGTAKFQPLTAVRWLVGLPIRLTVSPLIQGNGAGAWRMMKRRTRLMFHPESEFDGDCKDSDCVPPSGLLRLLDRIREEQCDVNGCLKIDLVGHSMGGIIANHILRRAVAEDPAAPKTPAFDRVAFMASAASLREYVDGALAYSASREPQERPEIFNLTLHETAEATERHPHFGVLPWQVLDLTPPGSLLVWIDDFYEHPETLMDTTAGRFLNLMHAEQLTAPDLRHLVSYKAFPEGDMASPQDPGKHGDFGSLRFWDPEFWKPLPQSVPEYTTCGEHTPLY